MKVKQFLVLFTLLTSTAKSADLFFSAGASMSNSDECDGTFTSEISAGINLTNQISSRITYTDMGTCEFWDSDYNYYSYSHSVNEITFRFMLPNSGHSSIFFEGGYGQYSASGGYSTNTAIAGAGISMPLNTDWSWEARVKIYPEEYETISNIGASLTYNF